MTDTPQAEETTKTRRVLLAEDNPANRKLALAMLSKLGYAADAVINGVQAVEASAKTPYDVLLMDCRMPEMDGFRATAEIRAREDTSSRIPIIAMTADAMEGDRQRCLDAGMDDYLAKPVSFERLAALLDKWIPSSGSEQADLPSERDAAHPTDSVIPVLDQGVIADLRRLGDDRDPTRMQALISTFLLDAGSNVKRLRRAIEDKDAPSITERLHTLAGSAATFGAQRLARLSRELKARSVQMGQNALRSALNDIETELARVTDALRAEFPSTPGEVT